MTESTGKPRLIEVAFPLREASIDSVHEKDIRSGHISSIHVWPARRPLAASRAAIVAALLPAPGTPEEQKRLLGRLAGRVISNTETRKQGAKTVEITTPETEGGILHWGRENSPDLEWFRAEIRKAFGGRAPRVLDPFAGGGAIPLEAMRLGCEASAIDLNPVAWFVLKCTVQYPQRFVGKTLVLPRFADAKDSDSKKPQKRRGRGAASPSQQSGLFPPDGAPQADLIGQVRVWGEWVLDKARDALARYYPAENGEKPVAYLWARTVVCKNCRSTIPLLKTRWLARTSNSRVILTMAVRKDKSGVEFGVQTDVPVPRGNAKQARDAEKRLGQGTMSRTGVTCPCCGVISTMEDLRLEGQAGRLGMVMTAVASEGKRGKVFRVPTPGDLSAARAAERDVQTTFEKVPFGIPTESMPGKGALGFRVPLYGIDNWSKLYTPRQLVALGTLVRCIREARTEMRATGVPEEWVEAIHAYLVCGLDRLVDFANVNTQWKIDRATINHALVRFAVQMTWDFAEGNPVGSSAGSFQLCLDRVLAGLSSVLPAGRNAPPPTVLHGSALGSMPKADLIITDPPYYDAIPYSDLMDWFYVWLRRAAFDSTESHQAAMGSPLSPKWDRVTGDGELIEDANRHDGDATIARKAYEDGMSRAFAQCAAALDEDGRLVVVFANKQPEAWETLVASLIRAGFVVEASWPIETEQRSRTRGQGSAALSSSIWLVARQRAATARPGWDNRVLDEMRSRIYARLRDFWDAGIRGPDFVWAATGPALEAYSRHPVVKKANEPGQVMGVTEFLRQVRRIVVDYVVGRVLSHGQAETVSGLDDVTTYYLLHRNDFGFAEAPAGVCILYAISCGLSDHDLIDSLDLLSKSGSTSEPDETNDDDDTTEEGSSAEGAGSKMRLKRWEQRKRKGMGFDSDGRPAPLIDQVHRLLHLWRTGDVNKVDEYLDARALKKSQLFHHLLQALIELAPAGDDERALLESISNHLASRPAAEEKQLGMFIS